MKKLTSLVLILVICLSLSACKTTPTETDTEPTPEYIENAFTLASMSVDAQGATAFAVEGDQLYFDMRNPATQAITLNSADLDSGNVTVLYEIENTPYDPASPTFETHTLDGFAVAPDGSVWFVTTHGSVTLADMSSTTAVRLVKIAPDGEETSYDVPNGSDSLPIAPRGMCADAAGNIYVASSCEVLAFNADGSYAFTIADNDRSIVGIVRAADGRAVYVTLAIAGSYATQNVKVIDFAEQKTVSNFDYKGTNYFMQLFPGDASYDLYFSDYGSINGWSFDENAESPAIDFMASDIDNSTIGGIAPIGDGSFITAERDASGAVTGFAKLMPNPTATRSGKTIITLGTIYVDNFTQQAIRDFNRNNADARIEVRDYSVYNTQDNWNLGEMKLDLDVANGNAPDILSFLFGRGSDPFKYGEKGAFVDLYEFLDSDADISRSDLFANVLEAGECNGELNILIPTYNVTTRVGKASIFGDETDITVAELAEIFDKYPNANIDYDVTGTSWTQYVVSANEDFFFGKGADAARFDTPEFLELLEFSKRLPTKGVNWEEVMLDMDAFFNKSATAYGEDRSLLFSPQMRDVSVIREARTRYGEAVTFIGEPSFGGSSGNTLMPFTMLAISAESENQETAWRFIKYMLREETYFANESVALPARISVFEKAAALEMTPLQDRDYSKGMIIHEVQGIDNLPRTIMSVDEVDMNDPYFANYALTEAEVAQVRAVIESANRVPAYDMQVFAILAEELAPFYAGTKTAEETARVIQSRVNLYINEKK